MKSNSRKAKRKKEKVAKYKPNELKENESFMSLAMDCGDSNMFMLDSEGNIQMMNKRLRKELGYSTADVDGKSITSYIQGSGKCTTESRSEGFRMLCAKTGNLKELKFIGKQGKILKIGDFRYFVSSLELLAIAEVVTKDSLQGDLMRSDMPEATAIIEQEFSRLIDTANAPIFGVDQNGRINVWNKKAATIMQYTTDEVMGRCLVEEFISSDYKVLVDEVLNQALKSVETENFEFPLITKDGRRVEILLNATPRYNQFSEVVGVVGIGQDITDRILQEQEYSRLIDKANAPIFGVDTGGLINIWNNKAGTITQYSDKDAMGKHLVETFITAEYRSAVRSVLESALKGIETANFEFPLVTKAGRRVHILLNATPRYDQFGNVVGMVGIGQDITYRIAQEEEYSRLINGANAPIFGVGKDGCVNIWNKKAAEITQYTAEEVMGKNLTEEFITAGHRKLVANVFDKALSGRETANFVFPMITKQDCRLQILLNATPRYSTNGDIVGVVGIGQDITDRVAQEQEYTRLIETANAPIFGVDKNGCINIWNNKAASITQYMDMDAMGKHLVGTFITEDYKQAVGRVLHEALKGNETANFEFPLITKSGRRVDILLNATPRYDQFGTVVGVVGIGQDITYRIVQEEEYSRLINGANAPIFGIDKHGCINIWNKKACTITQFNTEDVMGRSLVENFITSDRQAAVANALNQALEGKETANFVFPMITKSECRLEILLNATPRYDLEGAIVGVVGIGQDVTDRIAQEQEYSRLIDTANAPIFGVDINGAINIWNKKAAEITQYLACDVMGKSLVQDYISEDYRKAVGFVLEQSLNGIEKANFEFPLITKAGRRVEILLNATPRYNQFSEVVGVVGIGQDITDRIAQEQEYSRLIDKANAPIFGVDKDGCINIWNNKAADITGYSDEDAMGKHLVETFITTDYKLAVGNVLNQALEDNETANFEFPLITKAGRRVDILLNATPRYDQFGSVVGVVGIGQDITYRIAQEEEYSRLINGANAPIFGVGKDGCINIWNKKAATITQYSTEEVMGRNLVKEFITSDFQKTVHTALKSALQGRETANFVFPMITKNDCRLEILLNATPRYDTTGDIVGVVGIGQDITDRIAQEQEYTRLIETANAPIFGVDSKGRINIWNNKAAEITQYSNEDVIGKNLVEAFITADYKTVVAQVLNEALNGTERANFEFPLKTKAGLRVEILLNATPRYDMHGCIVGVVGIGQDITDRIAQEQEYSRLIDKANAPIFGVNVDGRINIWNKKAATITQYTADDAIGKHLVQTFITSEYRHAVGKVLDDALKDNETANFEFPLITKAGRRVDILLNATPRYDQFGTVVGVVGIGQDITYRIAQEEEYSRLINGANAPIFGVDKDGCINIWNKMAATITQYTTEEALGKHLVSDFISTDYRKVVDKVLSQALLGKETANFVSPMITKTDRRLEILLNATPRYNTSGEIVGVVGIGQDITERIAQEQEYTRLIDTANAPIFGVDKTGAINIWNKKAAEIMQYSATEVLGKNLVEDYISEDYRKAVGSVLEQSLNGMQKANFEFPLITKAGRRVEILLNATPRYDQFSEVVGVVGIGQDITERIAQEQEYTRLIDTANAPIFGVDRAGKINIWNNKAATITQYTAIETMGKHLVGTFITADYKEAVGRVLNEALNGSETANFEFPLMTKADRRVDILLNATPRYDQFGNVVGVVGIGQDITYRIAQEQEYSRLINGANAPIFGVDSKGCINIWNKKAAAITQYITEEVMGRNLVKDFITNDFKVAVRRVLHQALQGRETANFVFPMITKTDRRLEILLNATPRYDMGGEIVGVVGIGQDITERIAQEQEYTRLIDTANAPIFGVNKDGAINIWNVKAAEITQYAASEVMGRSLVKDYISEDYRKAVGSVLDQSLKGIETANFEFPLITKAGRRVEILLNATPRYNQFSEVVGVVGIGQDITDRIAQEQEYSRLIDTANAPIFGVDKDGCINIWNNKAAAITQFTDEDVMGKHLVGTFITADYKEAVGCVLHEALNGIEKSNFEFPLKTKIGHRVEILLNATPRYDMHGEIVGVVGIGQDITDRIAQEQEYSRLIEKANAPIFGVDKDGLINIWNNKAAAITQYTSKETMGKHLVETFITADYKEAVGQVLHEALNGSETANFEFPLLTKADRRVDILLNATPRYDQLGNVVGMVGIGQDISYRIAQEEEYSRLINGANAPIFGVNKNGSINIWNKKAAAITQYSTEEVMDRNLVKEFITFDFREAVGTVLNQALQGQETANFVFPMITKTDRRLEILLNATPRYDTSGDIVGVVGIGQDITERIAQEQEYTRLIDTANAPIFGVDAHGAINIWNKKAAEITQYSAAEVLGKSLVEDYISEDYKSAVGSVLGRSLDGVETANFEFPLITKLNRRVEILLNATPRYNQYSDVVGVVGIGQDITDRIAQEQEYTRLIDTANAPIFGVDANMRVNIWNRKAAAITHYSTPDVMGENLVETFISPEYRPIVADVISRALKGTETSNFEFPLITRPGNRIEILLNATPRFDQYGTIVGVVGIGQDITERIAQEHEYFRLIDTANAPIFGVNVDGCINEWNQKIEELTGYQKSNILGLSLVDKFVVPESRTEVQTLLQKALTGVDVEEMELPMTTSSGNVVLLLVNGSSKKDVDGRVEGVVGVGQDFTARKQMEQAKVNFLASFSHELRTPLNGVLGMLELLKEKTLEPTSQRYVHIAYVSGSLLLNLINDILDLSKIEAGHLEISAVSFPMVDLLQYSMDIFATKANDRGLELRLDCHPEVPQKVVGDLVRLRQVLLNLLSNAIKFTTVGSITVRCRCMKLNTSSDGHFAAFFTNNYETEGLLPIKLAFEVIDTGTGMDAEEKSRLFSLFTKLERTRKCNPTGSGLGLAICKQLAELMGGEIDVESKLGVGSNFHFTVIVACPQPNATNSSCPVSGPLDASLPISPSGSRGRSTSQPQERVEVPKQARILVVEDNEFNWEVVKCFLQVENHHLKWDVNGSDAFNTYKEFCSSLDLVFMDCEMPVMDGYSATRAIRQYEFDNHLPPIPIIGLTAFAMSGDRQKCLDAGMDEFIVKPISKNELISAIGTWLVRRYSQPGRVLNDIEYNKSANDPFVKASINNDALDLNRAISDLELENPMMMQKVDIRTKSQVASDQADTKDMSNHLASPALPAAFPNSSMFSLGNSTQSQKPLSETLYQPFGRMAGASTTYVIPNDRLISCSPTRATSKSDTYPELITKRSKDNITTSSMVASSQWQMPLEIKKTKSIQKKESPKRKLPSSVEIPYGDPIDYARGLLQCSQEESLYLSILEKYFKNIDVTVGNLVKAFNGEDYVTLRREAHSLKGSSAYVAAMRLSKCAFRVELASGMIVDGVEDEQCLLSDAFNAVINEAELLKRYMRRNFTFCQNTAPPRSFMNPTTSSSSEDEEGKHCIIS